MLRLTTPLPRGSSRSRATTIATAGGPGRVAEDYEDTILPDGDWTTNTEAAVSTSANFTSPTPAPQPS